jgi:sigma-B regulation protein RsbU (phosphoserine phosphatase)
MILIIGGPMRVAIGTVLATMISGVIIYRTRQREHSAIVNLAKEQEKYRIVADNTFDWEFWIGPDGTVIYSSPSCRESTGRTAAEFYAEPDLLFRIVHPDDRLIYDAHRHAPFAGSNSTNRVVFRILHTDGSIRWIEQTCCSVADDSGHNLGVRGSNRDITARKQAEQAKDEALARVQTIEGTIPICMYCKKIRDNQNSWSQLEKYITEHSEAKFSHGICPHFLEEHRSEFE